MTTFIIFRNFQNFPRGLVGINVRLELPRGLLSMVWDSSQKLIQRHFITIFISQKEIVLPLKFPQKLQRTVILYAWQYNIVYIIHNEEMNPNRHARIQSSRNCVFFQVFSLYLLSSYVKIESLRGFSRDKKRNGFNSF